MEDRDESQSGDRMLTCSQIELLLDDYVNNELDDVLRLQFERHLARCESCAGLVYDCQRIVEVARTLADEPIPTAVSRRLRQRLAEETGCPFAVNGLHVIEKDTE